MGHGRSLPEQERTLDINVDMFTTRGPSIPDGAPFNFREVDQIFNAYKKFQDSNKTIDLFCLSGKEYPCRYNLDETRPPGDRLLICWDWLAPMFWGPPPGTKSWANLRTIVDFIKQNDHHERCKVLATDTCSCSTNQHTVVQPGLECEDKVHWHHFCNRHVAAWLTDYVVPAILLKESKEKFNDYIAVVHKTNPEILEYYRTGDDRTDTQIMLETVRNMIDCELVEVIDI